MQTTGAQIYRWAEPCRICGIVCDCSRPLLGFSTECTRDVQELCSYVNGGNEMKLRNRRGQNVIEYTMLIIIVAAALMAMTTYVMRSMNARLKQTQDELNYYRQE